jgi:hypothetical protein
LLANCLPIWQISGSINHCHQSSDFWPVQTHVSEDSGGVACHPEFGCLDSSHLYVLFGLLSFPPSLISFLLPRTNKKVLVLQEWSMMYSGLRGRSGRIVDGDSVEMSDHCRMLKKDLQTDGNFN